MPFSRSTPFPQYYETQGKGSPILFLHHFFGTAASWQAQRDALSRHYTVLAVDLRGHGRTGFPGGRIGLPEVAGDVEALIGELGMAPVNVVGSSYGALTALHLARERPDLVNTVIAIGPPNLGTPSARAYADRFIEESFPKLRERFEQEHRDQPSGHVIDVLLRNFALDTLERPEPMTAALARAGEVVAPSLVIAGDNDIAFPPASALALAARLPAGELCVLPGAGHFPHRSLPTLVSQVLTDFLRRHE